MTTWFYLHTWNGLPAYFDGEQILPAFKSSKRPQPLVESLAQLRREQQLAMQYRASRDWPALKLDYVRVSLPGQPK